MRDVAGLNGRLWHLPVIPNQNAATAIRSCLELRPQRSTAVTAASPTEQSLL